MQGAATAKGKQHIKRAGGAIGARRGAALRSAAIGAALLGVARRAGFLPIGFSPIRFSPIWFWPGPWGGPHREDPIGRTP